MKTIHLFMAAAAALATATPASAAAVGDEGIVNFTGTVDTHCDLSVTDGSLGLNADRTEMSSVEGAGRSGVVAVNADEGFQFILGTPTAQGPVDDIEVAARARVGQTDIEPGIPFPLGPNDESVTVDLAIGRTDGTQSLPGGDYSAQVRVTCEPDLGPLEPR